MSDLPAARPIDHPHGRAAPVAGTRALRRLGPVALVSRFRSSQALATPSDANFGIKRDTSKLVILVRFLDLKFLRGTRGNCAGNFKSTALGTPAGRQKGVSFLE